MRYPGKQNPGYMHMMKDLLCVFRYDVINMFDATPGGTKDTAASTKSHACGKSSPNQVLNLLLTHAVRGAREGLSGPQALVAEPLSDVSLKQRNTVLRAVHVC